MTRNSEAKMAAEELFEDLTSVFLNLMDIKPDRGSLNVRDFPELSPLFLEYAEKFEGLRARVLLLMKGNLSESFLENFIHCLSEELQTLIQQMELMSLKLLKSKLQDHLTNFQEHLAGFDHIPDILNSIQLQLHALAETGFPKLAPSTSSPKPLNPNPSITTPLPNFRKESDQPNQLTSQKNKTNPSSSLNIHAKPLLPPPERSRPEQNQSITQSKPTPNIPNTSSLWLNENFDTDQPEALYTHKPFEESLLVPKSIGVNPEGLELDVEVEESGVEPISVNSSRGLKIDDEMIGKRMFVKDPGKQEASNAVNMRLDPSSQPLMSFSLEQDMDHSQINLNMVLALNPVDGQFTRSKKFVKDLGKRAIYRQDSGAMKKKRVKHGCKSKEGWSRLIPKHNCGRVTAWSRRIGKGPIWLKIKRLRWPKVLKCRGRRRNNSETALTIGCREIVNQDDERIKAVPHRIPKLDGYEESWSRRIGRGPEIIRIQQWLERIRPDLAQKNEESWSR